MLPEIEEIHRRRKLLRVTQKRLAKLAGVGQSTIAKLESGKYSPSYALAKKIFEVLEREELKERRIISVKEIATKNVLGVKKNDAVSMAVKLMREHSISQLPVFDNGFPVGSFSEKTIIEQFSAGKELSKLSAMAIGNFMDEAFPTIEESAPISVVSSLLQYSPAILVTKKGRTEGIVTKADVLKIVHR